MLTTLARASEMIFLFSFSLSSEEKKAVMSPVAVIVPVTANVEPSNVRFASALMVEELTEVMTLLSAGFV
jgi:hypothetical protein